MKIKVLFLNECYMNQGSFEMGLSSMGWSVSHHWVLLESRRTRTLFTFVSSEPSTVPDSVVT